MDVVVVVIIFYVLFGKLVDVSVQLLERFWLCWNLVYYLKEVMV